MFCPKCGHKQTCPCKACQARNPSEKPWVWHDDTHIACGNCGLLKFCDWWQDLEMEVWKEVK